jgi:signal transduction histidine kinase
LLEAERAAREEGESANRVKSQFLAVMSHELRTPLNAIAGHVQLMEMGVYGPITDGQRDALERVGRSQRHLLRLINDLLNLARVESGRVECSLEPVLLQDVVKGLLPIVDSQLAAKMLTLDIRLPTDPLVVSADREKLAQVLLNLLSNAAKFTLPGGRVTIDVASRVEVPDVVFVRVSDTRLEFRAASRRRSSNRSCRCTSAQRGRPTGLRWGWRSAVTWRVEWVATCGFGASRAKARHSLGRCTGGRTGGVAESDALAKTRQPVVFGTTVRCCLPQTERFPPNLCPILHT